MYMKKDKNRVVALFIVSACFTNAKLDCLLRSSFLMNLFNQMFHIVQFENDRSNLTMVIYPLAMAFRSQPA